jgi:lipopolysaccharide biosynthesis regulator YciM
MVLHRALEILEDSSGADGDRAAIVVNNLAKVQMSRGKYAEAQGLCHRALEILENVFDEHHPNVAEVLETLIKLHRMTGDEPKAAQLERRAEQIRVRKRVAFAPTARTIQ